MAESGKFYWLKLKRDFFKRHDIRIIEEMPNGKDYILFYLKLLLESIDHEGSLRFSDTIPYNEQMLSVVTNTNVDIVRAAMKLFIELNMVSVLDDQTIYMNEVDKLIGGETKWAEKKRLQRAKEDIVPMLSSICPTEIDIKTETNKEIQKENISASPKPTHATEKPTKHKNGEYGHVLLTDEQEEKLIEEYGHDIASKAITFLDEYIEMKGYKAKNHYLAIRKWVVGAVKEREPKGNIGNSFDTDDFFQAALSRSLKNN